MSSEDGPALDRATLEELSDELGDDAVDRILGEYLHEIPRYVSDLRAAVTRGDAAAAERAAHSLKGASLLVGGRQLGGACDRVERVASRGGMTGLETDVADIERLSTATAAAVRKRLGR